MIRLVSLILLLSAAAHANEALDVLEGRKKAADVELPPAIADSEGPAGESSVYQEPRWAPSPLDPLWSRAVLFSDPENPYIQQLAVTGFIDFNAAFGTAETDAAGATPSRNTDLDGSRVRRARLGARLRAFSNTDIEGSFEFAGDGDFRGVERLSARTAITDKTAVTFGKFRPRFTAEQAIEPEFLPTPHRSMLVNQIAPASTLGVRFDREIRGIDIGLGWFSGDFDADFPGVEGDGLLTLNLGRTFIEPAGDAAMGARWHFDYIHNFDAGRSETVPRFSVAGRRSANGNQPVARNPGYRHLVSTGVTLEQERFGFLNDFMLARGDSSAWGLTLSPTWWVLPGTLQVVGRYYYAASKEAAGLVTTMGVSGDPLFDASPFFVGDEFHSFYLGGNLHLHRDRMILMGGLEHVILKDEEGGGFNTDAWIWHAGARVSF